MRNIIIHIVLMTFTHQHEGYIIQVNKSKLLKYGVDNVLQKYLNPVRRLAEDLPNHNVEVQLEIVGSITQAPIKEPKRYIRIYQPNKKRRSGDDVSLSSSNPITTTVSTISETYTPPTPPSTSEWLTAPSTPSTTGIGKQPVYMDDLKKALEDFEKKFYTTAFAPPTTTSYNQHHSSYSIQQLQVSTRRHISGPVYPVDRSIYGLIKLLRQGIHLDSPVNRPTNENLEWLQLKVPKTK